MVQAVKSGFSKYATFRGRATRSEFWWFYLFLIIVGFVLSIADNALGWQLGTSTMTINDTLYDVPGAGVLSSFFSLATLLPFLAVGARRLHDAGHSGLWLIWGALLTPLCLVGVIILIVFFCQKSEPGDTKYGPHPTT